MLKKRTFRALMAYLNTIGPIGTNIDMFFDEVEYFGNSWATSKVTRFNLLEIFEKFIYSILTKYAKDLYNNTNKEDQIFWVDTTIDPKKREIRLVPKYYSFSEQKDNRRFDWRELRNYYSLSKFMEDRELEELIIDYSGFENNFDTTITYNGKQLNNQDNRFFSDDIRNMISEILENDNWNEWGGGHGVMKLYNQGSNGYLNHIWVDKKITSGTPIILKEEDFK